MSGVWFPRRAGFRVKRPRRAERIGARDVGITVMLELVVKARPMHAVEHLEVLAIPDHRSVTSNANRIGHAAIMSAAPDDQ